ncbi:MAG: hypothetical protein IPG06_23270 [Haliea sp.]|jgi:hypothetical protein|nr:hypothetical protein [Haliea sp.]
MNLSNVTKVTLSLALLMALASCGSEEKDEQKPQESQQVTQADQPKPQVSQPKPQDSQPKAQAEKAKAPNDGKKWLPPAMADIGLTAEQEAKLKPVTLEARKQLKAVREDTKLDSAAKKEKQREIGQATNKQYKAILTPEQWKSFLKARQAEVKAPTATPTAATPAANQPEAKKE